MVTTGTFCFRDVGLWPAFSAGDSSSAWVWDCVVVRADFAEVVRPPRVTRVERMAVVGLGRLTCVLAMGNHSN